MSERVKTWSKRPLKTNKVPYPICNDGGDAPKFFWLGIWCAPRGHGKTYGLVKLLKHYENHGITTFDGHTKLPQRIILFSPTYEANPIFKNLKWLDDDDVIPEYSDSKLREVIEDIDNERRNTDAYHRQLELYAKFQRVRSMDEMSDAEILELEGLGFLPPQKPKLRSGGGFPPFGRARDSAESARSPVSLPAKPPKPRKAQSQSSPTPRKAFPPFCPRPAPQPPERPSLLLRPLPNPRLLINGFCH